MTATTSTRTHSLGQRSVVFAALLALLSWSFIVASPTTAGADHVEDGCLYVHIVFVHSETGETVTEEVELCPDGPVNDIGHGVNSTHRGYLPEFTVPVLHVSCSDDFEDNPVFDGEGNLIGYDDPGSELGDWLAAPTQWEGETVPDVRIENYTTGSDRVCGPVPLPDHEPDPESGSLTVTKTVTADEGADPDTSFEFNVSCADTTDETFTLGDGDSWGPEDFDAGTVCTVTETDPDGDAEISIDVTPEDAVDSETANSVTVTIGVDVAVSVEFTNHYPFEPEPGDLEVSLTKTNDADGDGEFSDEEEAPEPGADVPFHVEIENTGEVEVTITSLLDEFDGVVVDLLEGEVIAGEASIVENDCDELANTTIAVGGTIECSFTLGGYAPDWGESLTDTVTVDVEDDEGREESADDDSTVTTDDEPVEVVGISADITKTNDADGDGEFSEEGFAENEGDAVDFELEIFNDNPVDVVIVELTDSYDDVVIDLLAGEVLEGEATLTANTCADLDGATIPADDSVTCTFTLEDYAPAGGGDVTNVAFVELEDPVTGERADAADVSVVETVEQVIFPEDLEPDISIVKEADVSEAEVGDVITYTYTVTNTGDTTLTDITVHDDVLGDIELESTTLEPGGSTTGTATHTVSEDDLEAGDVHNVAVVTGWPPEGDPVTAEDDALVTVFEQIILDRELPVTGFDALEALLAALLALSLGGATLLGLRLQELRGRRYGTA